MAIAVLAFSSSAFANDSNGTKIDKISTPEEIVLIPKITVKGKNEGTTVTEVTSTDGSVTTVIDIECDNFWDELCYTVETSAQLTEIELPSEGKLFKGILLDSNPAEDKYTLLKNQ